MRDDVWNRAGCTSNQYKARTESHLVTTAMHDVLRHVVFSVSVINEVRTMTVLIFYKTGVKKKAKQALLYITIY